MTAMTAQRALVKQDTKRVRLPVAAAAKIFLGAMVCLTSAGYAAQAADTAGYRSVCGLAVDADVGDGVGGVIDNTSGSNGDLFVIVESDVIFKVAATSIAQAQVGTPMFVVDDQTVDDVAGVTNKVMAGRLVRLDSSTVAWVYIPPFALSQASPDYFFSAEVTGTGSSQSTAHNLGVIPSKVLIIWSEAPAALGSGADTAYGTMTNTNVVVTVTSGIKYFIAAWR